MYTIEVFIVELEGFIKYDCPQSVLQKLTKSKVTKPLNSKYIIAIDEERQKIYILFGSFTEKYEPGYSFSELHLLNYNDVDRTTRFIIAEGYAILEVNSREITMYGPDRRDVNHTFTSSHQKAIEKAFDRRGPLYPSNINILIMMKGAKKKFA